jgi:hypothetical protein
MDEYLREAMLFMRNKKATNYSEQWLPPCVEWVVSELTSAGKRLSTQAIVESVYEQWLMTDLKDTCLDSGCLPPISADVPKIVINGSFALQVRFPSLVE